ncbi:MAG: uroporphyrinogen-III synthase [Rhodospirillaceae bacterium]
MRALVTRPGADGTALAETLSERGIDAIIEPLMTIENLDGPDLDLNSVQALLVTSQNGVRALTERTTERSIPVYAVGDSTAGSARELEFKQVHSASGDVEALSALVIDMLDPAKGPLVHVVGSAVAGDLAGDLTKAGFEVRREVLYETQESKSFSPAAIAAIKNGDLDTVLLYSPRTADAFVQLIRKARLVRSCKDLTVFCLSPAVAEKISEVTWQDVIVAESPTQDSLLTAVSAKAGVVKQKEADMPSSVPKTPLPDAHTIAPIQRRSAGNLRAVFLTLLTVVILGVVVFASRPLWQPQLAQFFPFLDEDNDTKEKLKNLAGRLQVLEKKSTDNVPQLEELQAERARIQARLDQSLKRISDLENSISTVKQMVSAVDADGGSKAALETLKQLSERLQKLESGSADSSDTQRKKIVDLEVRLAELAVRSSPQGQAAAGSRARAFMLAVGQLRQAVQSSRPYLNELAGVLTLLDQDDALRGKAAGLQPSASRGIPTLEQLRTSFKSLAASIVQAEKLPKGDGWIDRTVARIAGSLKWRRTDQLEGASVDAVVARAERLLAASDLSGALVELNALPEKASGLAQPWMANAKLLVQAEQFLADLQVTAVSLLTPKE